MTDLDEKYASATKEVNSFLQLGFLAVYNNEPLNQSIHVQEVGDDWPGEYFSIYDAQDINPDQKEWVAAAIGYQGFQEEFRAGNLEDLIGKIGLRKEDAV